MKTQELIELVNKNKFKTLIDFEQFEQKHKNLNIQLLSKHQNQSYTEARTKKYGQLHVIDRTATNVYKCENGYVGITGFIYSEFEINKPCKANEFMAIPKTEYVSIERAKENYKSEQTLKDKLNYTNEDINELKEQIRAERIINNTTFKT